VPAVAVIRRGQVLFVLTGRKACVGCYPRFCWNNRNNFYCNITTR